MHHEVCMTMLRIFERWSDGNPTARTLLRGDSPRALLRAELARVCRVGGYGARTPDCRALWYSGAVIFMMTAPDRSMHERSIREYAHYAQRSDEEAQRLCSAYWHAQVEGR